MDLHVRDLRYFVAVAEELHFTRAAESLHISQPSLSRQIRVLERDLGFPLFTRDRRAVALTAGGEALLPRARALLESWDAAFSEVARLWLPVPARERLTMRTLWTEPRHVALWSKHPLAGRAELRLADLLDEPFVALPPAAGVLRDHWLAVEERDG